MYRTAANALCFAGIVPSHSYLGADHNSVEPRTVDPIFEAYARMISVKTQDGHIACGGKDRSPVVLALVEERRSY